MSPFSSALDQDAVVDHEREHGGALARAFRTPLGAELLHLVRVVRSPLHGQHALAVRLADAEELAGDRVRILADELAELLERVDHLRLFGERVAAPLFLQALVPGLDRVVLLDRLRERHVHIGRFSFRANSRTSLRRSPLSYFAGVVNSPDFSSSFTTFSSRGNELPN